VGSTVARSGLRRASQRRVVSGHQARKRFGQHFLVDQGILRQIADECAKPSANAPKLVIEIGPGQGALTAPLLSRLGALTAIEIDRDLALKLEQRYSSQGLTLVQADVLSVDFSQFSAPYAVVGNLPYNISSPLLIRLIEHATQVSYQVFMLQKEVVMRMVASPGTAQYSRLSVMLQAYYTMQWRLDVPPQAFDPPPRVDSAVVRMTPLADCQVKSRIVLERVLAQAFSQRRKMIRSYFLPWLADQGLNDSGLEPTARAEQIDVPTWITLANRLAV
jgi:16S rRNA (adenine1518-N6/adenine1519-N6)-dimethyltransferase